MKKDAGFSNDQTWSSALVSSSKSSTAFWDGDCPLIPVAFIRVFVGPVALPIMYSSAKAFSRLVMVEYPGTFYDEKIETQVKQLVE
jgi:hypothetical protein